MCVYVCCSCVYSFFWLLSFSFSVYFHAITRSRLPMAGYNYKFFFYLFPSLFFIYFCRLHSLLFVISTLFAVGSTRLYYTKTNVIFHLYFLLLLPGCSRYSRHVTLSSVASQPSIPSLPSSFSTRYSNDFYTITTLNGLAGMYVAKRSCVIVIEMIF